MSHHQFSAEIGKVLHLVIHSIYTNREIFVRELISNASDACDKLRYLSMVNSDQFTTRGELAITVSLDPKNSTITFRDTGVGMDEAELITNLGSIAHSGTQKFLAQLEEQSNHQQIGQFGVGFYSAFMVADHIKVYSTKATASAAKTYVWTSDGTSGFEVHEHDEVLEPGTIIEMRIKKEETDFIDKYRMRHIISTYSDHIDFPIKLVDENGAEEVVNHGNALWVRPKAEISENEYNEFFRSLSHTPEAPWMTIHNKVEGNLEYTSLLYLPKNKPYDLFHPDRKSRIKLYIKRVFITDDALSILPSYLRFVRGIIDSNDLPLNLSRETLQYNSTVNKIRKSLVKRIFVELKKKAEQEPQEYVAFWQNFGEVLKEGLCENALDEKEMLLEACRFHTTKSGEGLVSLEQYVDNMLEGQDQIFYITGGSLENLRNNPQIEGFTSRGIEVLLLNNNVDDFWIHVINQYKNHEMKNVVHCDFDLDKIAPSSADNEPPVEGSDEVDSQVLAVFKAVLQQRIKDVKISKKLINSPSCLSIPDGAMSSAMERMLLEQRQLHSRSTKILEINPRHPLVKRITDSTPEAADLVEIIFAQACLLAGEPVDGPHAVVDKINRLILKEAV